jgi:thymidylate synthase (FAD)
MILPQSTMTEWYWTGSLSAWARFYLLRIDPDAQEETRELAQLCGVWLATHFPLSWDALTKRGRVSALP